MLVCKAFDTKNTKVRTTKKSSGSRGTINQRMVDMQSTKHLLYPAKNVNAKKQDTSKKRVFEVKTAEQKQEKRDSNKTYKTYG